MGHIKLRNLGFRFESRRKQSLEDISLQIEQGETVLLAGRSGSGKSTLLHCLNGLIPEYYPGTLHGCIRVGNGATSWREIPLWQKAEFAGTVFQDPRHQFFSARVEQELLLSLWRNEASLPAKQQQMADLLAKVGMEGFDQRLLDSLSSGEQQRVAIGAALASQPKILLLDEPSANLSEDGITALRNVLQQEKKAGTTIVLAEHRFGWLGDLVDSLLVLDRGTIAYHGSPEKLDDADFCQNFGLRRQVQESSPRVSRSPESARNPGGDVVSILDTLGFRHKKQNSWLFRGLNAKFHAGGTTALTGKNGCGKTTLLALLYGLYKPVEGMIDFPMGRPVMALALQHPDLQLFSSTVLDELHMATDQGEEWLERFGLWPLRDRHPLTLSGGEMQRLVLAVAFATVSSSEAPSLLLLDEPTSGMDGWQLRALCREIHKIQDQQASVVMATHDSDLITATGAASMGIPPE